MTLLNMLIGRASQKNIENWEVDGGEPEPSWSCSGNGSGTRISIYFILFSILSYHFDHHPRCTLNSEGLPLLNTFGQAAKLPKEVFHNL